ncbi:GntR family transcriptional regulator [Mollicutes bacterium LVI A0039]|nr:GntR family transcriptional regulator [Mollicutes bacterium LVI A0039]
MYAYMRVCSSIIEDLNKGVYGPDQKMPTEKEMCEQFDVSISTIRKSMYYLRDKGLIYAKRGSGYYVTRKQSSFSKLERPSLSQLGVDEGIETKLIAFTIRRCSIAEARDLKIKVNSIIYEILRERRIDKAISQVEYSLIPVNQVPDILEEDARVSLNKVYQTNGIERVKVGNRLLWFDEETLALFKRADIDLAAVQFNLERKLEKLDGQIIELSKILVFDQELSYDYIHLY